MEPELFSQAGMEASCRKFSDRLNAETDQRGPSFNVFMQNRYESCCFEKKTLLLSFPVEETMRNPMASCTAVQWPVRWILPWAA